MLQKLEPESRRKAPSVIKVFRMYCMEELSVRDVSSRCHCSNSTVMERLNVIESQTGIPPKDLRRLSPHIEKLEDELADSRAKCVNRNEAI